MTGPEPTRHTMPVEIRRSARRRRTVSARIEDGRIIVLAPASMPAAEEKRVVDKLVTRLTRDLAKKSTGRDDAWLRRLADRLAAEFLDPITDRPRRPQQIRWASNQQHRWGSCTIASGHIRISDRLARAPEYVVAAVVVHELAHLSEPGHGPKFRALEQSFPQYELARAWLAGWSAGAVSPYQGALDQPEDPLGDDAN